MTRNRSALFVSIIASGALHVPVAEAKLGVSISTEPSRPTVARVTQIVVRTKSGFVPKDAMRLFVVGPWRTNLGQASFEVRLVRGGPLVLRGRLRFPHAGRWHLSIPASATSGHGADLWVRVLPRR